MKKELVSKTKEAANLQKTINKAKVEMKNFIEQAKVAKKAQDEAEERPGAAEAIAKVLEAEAKTAEAQAELVVALATKEAEIKAADEKAYAEGMADVKEDYKKQVKKPTEDEAVSEEEAEAENKEEAAGAKSLTHPEQVDLTQDEEDEVSKDASPEKTTSNMPIADKSIDQTLQEIDVELVAEKATEENSQKSSEPQTNVDAEQSSP
ncbi:neurofilament medium polypeptide-like [Camellia sinensis]|uniref:neurofilament medium polypeptide-like n=1 Tax=Camellia sinensis TaxID=4442 RepID=UPI00103699BF|nr:neurofilament medium polypeptide-like [Camellia sinensis]